MLTKSIKDAKFKNLAFFVYYQITEDYVSQKENFELLNDGYYAGVPRIKVIDRNHKWKLNLINKSSSNNYGYFKKGDFQQKKNIYPGSLAKVSFVLAFKFHKIDIDLKAWARLNAIRNDIGHGREVTTPIQVTDLIEIVQIVQLFLTAS